MDDDSAFLSLPSLSLSPLFSLSLLLSHFLSLCLSSSLPFPSLSFSLSFFHSLSHFLSPSHVLAFSLPVLLIHIKVHQTKVLGRCPRCFSNSSSISFLFPSFPLSSLFLSLSLSLTRLLSLPLSLSLLFPLLSLSRSLFISFSLPFISFFLLFLPLSFDRNSSPKITVSPPTRRLFALSSTRSPSGHHRWLPNLTAELYLIRQNVS
ncbi:unnamed protein product [Acanthosepion pharaonis]|uniref:Uncharacterized protein n=1 Tax=Acanthosepion pharaonis TaxID=158019 RepID=A0A812D1Q3_ACAPH|nr:unnamed protein product [Sepia pharaonis]